MNGKQTFRGTRWICNVGAQRIVRLANDIDCSLQFNMALFFPVEISFIGHVWQYRQLFYVQFRLSHRLHLATMLGVCAF